MYIKNKLSALLLAAVLSVSAVAPSFAANSSPTGGGGGGGLTYVTTPETETPATETPAAPVQPEAPETYVIAHPNVNTTVEGWANGTGVKVTKVKVTGKKALITANVISEKGNTYSVDEIATGAIKKKCNKVTMFLTGNTKVRASIAKSKKARQTKKFVIKAKKGEKLKATQFSKKAFKKCTGKIIVYASAMTKKEFKKLVKRLKKGGFKGHIVYKE